MNLDITDACLVFPYSRTNGNAISALVASLDIHPVLEEMDIFFPDLKADPETINDQIQSYDRVILAYSVFTTQLDMVSQQIANYRKYLSSKKLLVVAGGPHAMGDPFSMLIHGADIVCTGEGEVVFREIILSFLEGTEFNQIDGIAYIDGENRLIKTAKPAPLDLSKFPPFSIKHQLIRPIEITRGCAWKCRFCQIRSRGGSPVRHRPINQILEYVQYTVDYFSDRRPDIRFVSPNALSYGSNDGKTLNLKKVETLLSGIRGIIGTSGKIYFGSFPAEVRPETITEESVSILKKYTDSKTIILGGQSGSDKLLLQSDRGHDSSETERAAKLLLEAGFAVDVDIIFGLPGETEEDVALTIEHMRNLLEMGSRIHSHTFLPLVGTPFVNEKPGTIHPRYEEFIQSLEDSSFLRGQHRKQQQQAKKMAARREEELKKRGDYERIRLL